MNKTPWLLAIGVSAAAVVTAVVMWLPSRGPSPGPELDAEPIAASPPPPGPPPVLLSDLEVRLRAARMALQRQELDRVEGILEPLRNPDGSWPEGVEELLRQAKEEVENRKRLDQAARELNAGNRWETARFLQQSKDTVSFAAEWQQLRLRLYGPATAKDAGDTGALSGDPDQLLEQGKELLRKRQFKEAQAPFAECLRLDPDNAECHLAIGSTYARLRDPEKGIQHYREFLRLAPGHPQYAVVEKLLKDYEEQRAKQR